jgi:heme-degrading monooxygenase HmoA
MVYTHGTWNVKPGQEDEFVRRWHDLGDWTIANYPGARGTLLRDVEHRNRFVSFGPWPTAEHAQRWRSSSGFRDRVDRILETLESFEPATLQLVAEIS